jgi:phosphomannomutase/phosphoglucomutase
LYRAKVECPMSLYPAILESVKIEPWNCTVRIEEIDGIKIWIGKDSWVLFRPSMNAPEFRVFAESRSEEEATRLGEEGMDFVIGAKKRLAI